MHKIILWCGLVWCGNVFAYAPADVSSLAVNLGTGWKLSHTQVQSNIATTSEYVNSDNNNEVLIQTTLIKPAASLLPTPDTFSAKLHDSTKQLMKKNNCTFTDIKNIPAINKDDEWGLTWECPENRSTGFMFFIDGDAKTMYTLTYKATDSYPLTPSKQQQMLDMLKTWQLCYKGKSCTTLIQ